jgi:hypothetical protein
MTPATWVSWVGPVSLGVLLAAGWLLAVACGALLLVRREARPSDLTLTSREARQVRRYVEWVLADPDRAQAFATWDADMNRERYR